MTKNNIEFSKEAAISYLNLCGCKLDNPEELQSYSPNEWKMDTSDTHNESDGRQRVYTSERTAKYNPDDNSVTIIYSNDDSTNTTIFEESFYPFVQTVSILNVKKSYFKILEDGSAKILQRTDTTTERHTKKDNYGGDEEDASIETTTITLYSVPDDFCMPDGIRGEFRHISDQIIEPNNNHSLEGSNIQEIHFVKSK